LLTLLLMGQPELKTKIESNKQFLQRIAIQYNLEGLNSAEMGKYISHRIVIAGGSVQFTPQALHYIFEQSGGIPRRINHICDMCLFAGFSKQALVITEDIAKEAVESLAR
jgi:type II secretory pathway predicted ATPase ExeA